MFRPVSKQGTTADWAAVTALRTVHGAVVKLRVTSPAADPVPAGDSPCKYATQSVTQSDVLCSEPRSCVKVEVAVQGSPSLAVVVVSVDVARQ